jgi:hypothetical protein
VIKRDEERRVVERKGRKSESRIALGVFLFVVDLKQPKEGREGKGTVR